jgi:hypothetical protein
LKLLARAFAIFAKESFSSNSYIQGLNIERVGKS